MRIRISYRAFILLEVLVSLSLIMPLLAALVISLKMLTSNFSKIQRINIDTFNFIRITELIKNISEDIDLHSFDIQPVVHKNGLIKLASGLNNKIMSASTSLKPGRNSDAITYLKLDISNLLKIDKENKNAAIGGFTACQLLTTGFKQEEYNSYAILGSLGFYEIRTYEKPYRVSNSACYYFSADLSDSMLFKKNNTNLDVFRFSNYVIPIKSIYTIYLDSSNTLRYLSHSGVRNIENQPILEKSGNFKIDSKKNLSNLIEINFEYIRNKTKNWKITYINSLSREGFYNFVLNLPE